MVSVDYKADQLHNVNPTMTNTAVNSLLKMSDHVVFQ